MRCRLFVVWKRRMITNRVLYKNFKIILFIHQDRLTLQFICTWCRLRIFNLVIEELSNWTVLSKIDYNCFVDHTTLFRRAAELFTACINRAATTTYRSDFSSFLTGYMRCEQKKLDLRVTNSFRRTSDREIEEEKIFVFFELNALESQASRRKEATKKHSFSKSIYLMKASTSNVYSTCIASRASTRLRREKMNWNIAREIRSQYSRARK
jgi:hypothetical protein